jgi:hypothetical protein
VLSLLSHPGINPEIYDRCLQLKDKSQTVLSAQQSAQAEQQAKEKSAEQWAKDLLN